jgi:hypothetical protein
LATLDDELHEDPRVIASSSSGAARTSLDWTRRPDNGLQSGGPKKTDISGIVLTKLDGTAKGGVIISIQEELGVPVRYIGMGEEIEDLQAFEPARFVQALFEN